MRYVYADIFFLVNFLFDFSLLYLAGRLGRAAIRGRRLCLAAAVGGAYSIASILPDLAFLMSLPVELLVGVLMVAVAYPPPAGRPFGRAVASLATLVGLFYTSAFVLGGASLAYVYLTAGAAGASGVGAAGAAGTVGAASLSSLAGGGLGVGAVFPAALFGAVLLHWAMRAGRERSALASLEVECRVVVSGLAAEFSALVDTGNRLRDPLSDSPVVIVEYRAVGAILPPAFDPAPARRGGRAAGARAARARASGVRAPEDGEAFDPAGGGEEGPSDLDDEPDLGRLAAALGGSPWSARLRVIPFTSLGRSSGLLVGFRPDEFVVGRRGRAVRRTDVVVCVSPRPLSAEGTYRALVPPEVLESSGLA